MPRCHSPIAVGLDKMSFKSIPSAWHSRRAETMLRGSGQLNKHLSRSCSPLGRGHCKGSPEESGSIYAVSFSTRLLLRDPLSYRNNPV